MSENYGYDDCDYDHRNIFLNTFLNQEHEYRALDNSNNNETHTEYGQAGLPFIRLVPSEYADGISEPAGADRASARVVSNLIFSQPNSIPSKHNHSNMVWLFGQFIDHTFTLTEEIPGNTLEIEVPQGDKHFDPQGTGEVKLTLSRSNHIGGQNRPMEQVNTLSPLIDASNIYGHNKERSRYLRSYKDGKMAMSEGDMLPIYTGQGHNAGTQHRMHMSFFSGDIRCNEHIGLTSMHIMWCREHNYWCRQIKTYKPDWNDEQIYQHAKIIIEAEMQFISYNEFLPAVLGDGIIRRYKGFQSDVNPQLFNEFAGACYRFHSMISSDVYEKPDGSIRQLRDAFFSSHLIMNEGGIDNVIYTIITRHAQDMDAKIVDDLRNMLFGPPSAGGHDLAALNIMRGRDHGLGNYNAVRVKVGLKPVTTFAEINAKYADSLAQCYSTVDDIDLFVGGLLETKIANSQLGHTFHRIVKKQFENIRDGDRFWYQNRLNGDTLKYVESVTLDRIIERNTRLKNLPKNVFFVPCDDCRDDIDYKSN